MKTIRATFVKLDSTILCSIFMESPRRAPGKPGLPPPDRHVPPGPVGYQEGPGCHDDEVEQGHRAYAVIRGQAQPDARERDARPDKGEPRPCPRVDGSETRVHGAARREDVPLPGQVRALPA